MREFRAFTQLAADNQYAHLGLALLGVLAQVHAAVAPLVPALSGEGEEGGDGLLPSATTGPVVAGPDRDVQGGADLGIAVSRSEVERQPSKAARRPEVKQGLEHRGPEPSETLAEDEPLQERVTVPSSKPEEKPKKSKKSRDEFDSLFDSLEANKPPKKKKKKQKKGDEFDDLFSSLV